MKIQKVVLWLVIGLIALLALPVAVKFIPGLLSLVLFVFVLGLLLDPEGTKAYALRVIASLKAVLKGIGGSSPDDSTKDDSAKDDSAKDDSAKK